MSHKTPRSRLNALIAKTTKHPTVLYVFDSRLKYNDNSAYLIKYPKPIFVFKNSRDDYSKRMKSERRTDSVYRARQRLYDLIESNKNAYKNPLVFVTLTFAQNIQDLKQSNRLFTLFLKKLKRFCNQNIAYICVPEFQKRGAVHYHVLFLNLPFIHYQEFESLWAHGFTQIHSVHNVKNISAYVCKYLSKDYFDSRLYGQRAFFSSRHLLRPSLTRDNLVIEEVLKNYVLQNVNIYSKITKLDYDARSNFCEVS